MWKVTLRDIREHFGRFLMSVIAVAIGVAFLTGTLAFRDILAGTFSNLAEATTGSEIQISGKKLEGDFGATYFAPIQAFDASLLDEVDEIEGVEDAYPFYQMMANTYTEEGKAMNLMGAPSYAMGFHAETDQEFLVEGVSPGKGEVVVEKSTATRADVSVGDTVVVFIDEPLKVKVSGILEFSSSMAGASVVFMNEAEIISYHGENPVTAIALLEESADPEKVRDAIQAKLGPDFGVATAEEAQQDAADMVGDVLDTVNIFLLVFVVIALVISTFIITNTFTISVRQRQKQFALLRSLGASPAQVFRAVLLQSIAIGVIGSLVGLLFGQMLASGIRTLLVKTGMPITGSLVVTPKTAITALIVGVVVTVVATVLPSWKAATTPAIEAMRAGSGEQEKPLKVRTLVGVVMLLLGALLLIIGSGSFEGGIFGSGAGLLFLAVIILVPAFVVPVGTAVGAVLKRIAPATGTLASRSLMASPRKTATTAVALAIGVALVTAGATVAASLKESMAENVDENLTFEIGALAEGQVKDIEPSLQKISAIDGVDRVFSALRLGNVTVQIGESDVVGSVVADYDRATFDVFGYKFVEGDPSVLDRGEAIVLDNFAEDHGIKVGDTITVMSDGAVELKVGAIREQGNLMFGGDQLVIGASDFDQIAPLNVAEPFMLVELADGANSTQVKEDIEDALADQYIWRVLDKDGLKGLVGQQVDMMLAMVYALLALSIIISILGIVNTLTLSVVDRTKEIGLLRAVGMQRGEVRRMIVQESIITTVLGAVVGISLGLALGLAMIRFMASGQEASYVIPWASIGAMLALALIVGVLAALLPARRAAKLKVLDAIAEA